MELDGNEVTASNPSYFLLFYPAQLALTSPLHFRVTTRSTVNNDIFSKFFFKSIHLKKYIYND